LFHYFASVHFLVLSQVQQSSASVEGLMEGIDFSATLTRAKFEMISNPVFQAVW
jgi:molecular chaperone DnaK (HSP70)